MPRTTAPSTNPRILSGYTPYADHFISKGSAPGTEGRRQLLLNDSHARDVQPEQVTCTRCAKTIRLQKGKNYHLAHWLDHRWRCDRVAPGPHRRERCLTLLDRKASLEADEDAKVVEPDRVVCGRCNKEVKLRKGRAYGLSCWIQHKTICQIPAYLSVSSSSASASQSMLHSGTEAHKRNPLIYTPPVASIDPQHVKCALCLAWIDIRHPEDTGVHVRYGHRISCVVNNFRDAKVLDWTRPRFFHPGLLSFASGIEVIDTRVSDSSDSDNLPPSQRNFSRSSTVLDQTCTEMMPPIICASENESTLFPSLSLPSLSSSIPTTSSNNSVASTPLPCSRKSPEHSLSRAWTSLENHVCEERKIKHLSPPQSTSLASDQSSRPPPYLERTPLSLPIPKGYWRFESFH